MTTTENILQQLPYRVPFRFVDEILEVDKDHIHGSFHLHPESDFYKGHFKNYPITPGVILTEIAAQIGLVCLGIFLNEGKNEEPTFPFVLTSTHIEFYKPVYPDETVWVESEKVYYRFGKLKCNVKMKNRKGETVCDGTIAGIQIKENHVEP